MRVSSPPDDVDRIVAAWGRERPDLDVSPLHIMSRLSRLARHLDLARRRAFTERGLESWEFDVLAALRRSGEPYRLTPSELVRETMVTSGTMTTRVDRLALRGLVERSASPTDRRAVLVALTPEGRHRVDEALAELVRNEQELLAGLDDETAQELAQTLRRLLTPFEGRSGQHG